MRSRPQSLARSPRLIAAALFLTLATCCLATTASASADSILCSAGSGAGQCERPQGLALDRATGHLYVADTDNKRVNVFDSSGSFLFSFGTPGTGGGEIEGGELAIAVDDDPTSASFHDVYLAERDNKRVQKFDASGQFIWTIGGGVNKSTGADLCTAESSDICGAGSSGGENGEFASVPLVAVAEGGTVLVADTAITNGQGFEVGRVQSFTDSGAFVARLVLVGQPSVVSALAAAVGGGFYLGLSGGHGEVRKYDAGGTEVTSAPFPLAVSNLNALATDGAGNLFASGTIIDGRAVKSVTKYSPAGAILARFGYDSIGETPRGLAPREDGSIYGSEPSPDRVTLFNAPAPAPLPCCLEATLGNTKATLKGSVNPEGKAATYHFEYVDRESFDKEGGFSSPKVIKTAESSPLPADFELHDAEAAIGCTNPPQPSCLVPNTEYRYRLVAKGEDGESSVEGQFETLAPFELQATWASDVGTDAGKIHATVNPLGIPAKAHFQYVEDSAYRADVEAQGPGHGFDNATSLPEVDLGSGSAGVSIASSLSQLPPGATYHYRVVVNDSFTSEASPEHAFTTFPLPNLPANSCPNAAFRTGPSAALPDCRAYEMVSPVDKNGGDIKVLGSPQNYYRARLEQSSADGDRFAYSSVTAFADAASAPWTSEYLATRHEGSGWSTHAISPPRESVSFAKTAPPFKFDVQYKAFSPDLSEGWLIQDTDPPLDACAPAGNLNLYRRDSATGAYEALTTSKPTNIGSGGYELELQGLSADGSKALFRANGALAVGTGPAPAKVGKSQLYMHTRAPGGGCGQTRLVSVLPNGKAATLEPSLGTFNGTATVPGESRGNSLTNAVSADGSRVFWSAGGILYARDVETEKTVQIGPLADPSARAVYWGASPDGTRVLFAVERTAIDKTLFEFNVDKALAGEPGTETLIANGFQGVAGTSEDLSRIYFVSSETLGGEGEAGKPNLYFREGGTTKLVGALHPNNAELPGGDVGAPFFGRGFSIGNLSSIANGARASIDGSHLVFVSAENLTGYDNHDAQGGGPALEVYLYDAQSNHLACISCNPSGARPAGRELQSEVGIGQELVFRQISAQLPVAQNQFVTPRALSADGNRLFFESYEALLARDTNGKADVYEWQRASSQDECDQMGAELYVPSSGGCLSLISSGQSSLDSEIADISPDGSDVFIRTAASLLPQDPGQIDVYDARVDGGIPQPPAQPAACEGEACQGPLSVPNDPTPASSAFEGAGNVSEGTGSSRCRKGTARHRGRCVAKKPKKKAKAKHRRHATR